VTRSSALLFPLDGDNLFGGEGIDHLVAGNGNDGGTRGLGPDFIDACGRFALRAPR